MAVRRSLIIRCVAVMVVGLLVAPAITECAGWVFSAAARHLCCANGREMAPGTTMTDCCAMSQQSDDAIPPDTQAARLSHKLPDAQFLQLADLLLPSRAQLSVEWPAARHTAFVPLYLRQASLLI